MEEKKLKRLIDWAKKKTVKKMVRFSVYAPDAREVYLAGDFNDWDKKSHPMKKNKEGVFEINLMLPPGRYEYKMTADGEWLQNIPGASWVPNTFGSYNCVIEVK